MIHLIIAATCDSTVIGTVLFVDAADMEEVQRLDLNRTYAFADIADNIPVTGNERNILRTECGFLLCAFFSLNLKNSAPKVDNITKLSNMKNFTFFYEKFSFFS